MVKYICTYRHSLGRWFFLGLNPRQNKCLLIVMSQLFTPSQYYLIPFLSVWLIAQSI